MPYPTFIALAWIDFKRVLRSWRWRSLVALSVVVAYFFLRGEGFGEGFRSVFPGGVNGVRWMLLLFAGGGIVLSVDLAGQVDRHRARAVYDSLPSGGINLQLGRLIAVAAAIFIPAAIVTALPFLPFYWEEQAPLVSPSAVFLAGVLMPTVLVASGAGLLGRAVTRSDGAGLVLGIILTAPCVYMWIATGAHFVFTTASPHFGILVPDLVLWVDGLAGALAAVCFMLMAAMLLRRITLNTPRRRAIPFLHRGLGASRMVLRQGHALTIIPVLVLLPAVLFPIWTIWNLIQLRQPIELRQPPQAAAIVPSFAVENREFNIKQTGVFARLEGKLTLCNNTSEPQAVAALDFGPAVELLSASAVRLDDASAPEAGLHLFLLDPPLPPGERHELTFEFAASRRWWREWAATEQREYSSFSSIPRWWGEPVAIRFATGELIRYPSPSPYMLQFPAGDEREWFGSRSEFAALPSSLFAAETVTVEQTYNNSLTVKFVFFPNHEKVARAFPAIYEPHFIRLQQTFGFFRAPLVYYETPHANGFDPMAIGSAMLDHAEEMLPDYNDVRNPTAPAFELFFQQYYRAAIMASFDYSFDQIEGPELLRNAWCEYLFQHGSASALTSRFRNARQHYVLVPWEWLHAEKRYPFDIAGKDIDGFTGPLLNRPTNIAPASAARFQAFHHMLRGLLGDEKYVAMLHDLFGARGHNALTLERLRLAAEKQYGGDLGWFFSQWLVEGVIPRYRLRAAEVFLVEKVADREIEYHVTATMTNEGSGRMPVPVVLETETENFTRLVWLEPGTVLTEEFRVPARPISIAIDPYGWISQEPIFNPQTKQREHSRLYLKKISGQRRE